MEDRRTLDQFPLARAYRRYLNATETRERHDAAYYLFELLLKYLAATAVSFYLHREERDHKVNATLKGLVRPSFGEWLRFLRECLRFHGATEDPDPVVRSLAELLDDRNAGWSDVLDLGNALRSFRLGKSSQREKVNLAAVFEEIVSYRNRVLGHGAPLGDEHYDRYAPLFGKAFRELLAHLPFLTARRLVCFDALRVRDSSRVDCSFVEYVGLQPVRRDEPLRLEYGTPTPSSDRLYLLSESGQFVSLDPFLIAHDEDVYVLNEARGEAEYLSYATGSRHRRSSVEESQKNLFTRIFGYPLDATRLSQLGEDVAAPEDFEASESGDGERRLGDYRIVRELGRGGMGTVFEAIQGSLGRRVALKVLPGSFALDVKRLERFHREARATARIHHPSIVPVYDVGEVAGTHYYTMEFLDGTPLDQLIEMARQESAAKPSRRSSSISDPGYIANTAEQIACLAEGLDEAHRQGLVHRDIKPSNIIVDRSGRYVLVDFGLVHDEEAQTITRSGEMVGTPAYMSPEQVSRRRVDARSDVYSLDATLYEVLTLRCPFSGESDPEIQSSILFDEPASPRKLNPRINRDLETVVLHALEKKAEKRYASAAELAADLRRFLRYEPVHAKPRSLVSAVVQRAWRRKRALATTGIIIVLVVTTAVLWTRMARERRLRRIAEYEPTVLEAIGKMQLGILSTVDESGALAAPSDPEEEVSALGDGIDMGIDPMSEAMEGLGRAVALLPDRFEAYYQRARGLVSLGRFDEALEDLGRVLAIAPASIAARLLRSTIHTQRGDMARARAELEEARPAVTSEWEEAWIAAHGALGRRRWSQAAEQYGRLLRLVGGREPYLGGLLEMRLGRGQARLHSGNFVGAIEDLEVVASWNPQAIEPVLLKGQTYVLWRKLDEAERVFRALFDRVPAVLKEEVALRVFEIYRGRKYAKALEWADELRDESRKRLSRAAAFSDQNDLEAAIAELDELVRSQPKNARAWYWLGNLHFERDRRGTRAKALACYRQAVTHDPELAEAHAELGRLFNEEEGKAEEAIRSSLEALRLDPGLRLPQETLFFAYLQLGRDGDAFRHACASLPRTTFRGYVENVWSFLRRKPDIVAASPEFDEVLERLERNLPAGAAARGLRLETLALAWAHHPKTTDRDRAVGFARRAVEETLRRDPDAFLILAEVHERFGELREAILALEEGVRLSVRDARLLAPLEDLRRAYRPRACSYASVDAWLEDSAREVLVAEGAIWQFFRGHKEPSRDRDWAMPDFPDEAWETGPSGFGYGNDDAKTILDDMRLGYTTVYLRHGFTVADTGVFEALTLSVDADDGFVAYLNGVEVARVRAGEEGERLRFDDLASDVVTDAVHSEIEVDPNLLVSGENCLAIHALNATRSSSDLSLIPVLTAQRPPNPESERDLLRQYRAVAGDAAAIERGRYFEARILTRAGKDSKALEILRELIESDPVQPEPILALAESLRSTGNPAEAEEKLRRRLERGGVDRDEDLWALWAEISRNDLGRSTGDILRALPSDPALRYRFVGDARWDPEHQHLVLNEAEHYQTGRAFYRLPLRLQRFTAEFELRTEEGGGIHGGADGLTLAFVRATDYPRRPGGRLDFGGGGCAVEFDTYAGQDEPTREHHIAVIRGEAANHLIVHELTGGLAQEVRHSARIELEGGRISVWFDGAEVISGFQIPDFEPFTGYLGFTAATGGGGYERHVVRNVKLAIPE